MLKRIYDKQKIKEYAIVDTGISNVSSYKIKSKSECNCMKCIIIFIILFIFIIFIIIFTKKHYLINNFIFKFFLKQSNNKEKIKINYNELIPKINLQDKNIPNLQQIFKSRRLYINNKNITNDYIRFLRPIDEKEEKKYNQKLYPDLSFNNYPNIKNEKIIDIVNFYKICIEEKLLDSKKYSLPDNPLISIILPFYNKKYEIIRSLRSIQNQSFKNIEIIIIDDGSTDKADELLENLFESEPRIRLFKHLQNMGVWRTRMDGFLYSNGKYILHFDPGDLYTDNYVLEDTYNLISKYNLDTVKFSFSKTRENINLLNGQTFEKMKIYPEKHTKIIYGRPDYNIYELGYGTIWNRMVRANLFAKGLELIDEYALNAYKNLWEDMWWNDLIDRVSFSNLIVNRLGYLYLYTHQGAGEPKIKNSVQRDSTIREFIYFWFFDYQLLPKNDNKKIIIDKLRKYDREDNTFCRLPMRLDYLTSKFPIYERLLNLLINDPFVIDSDKEFLKSLYNKYTKIKN